MAQRPINSGGGEARLVHGRIRRDQAAWLDEIASRLELTKNNSEVLRRLIDVARQHEEELTQAS